MGLVFRRIGSCFTFGSLAIFLFFSLVMETATCQMVERPELSVPANVANWSYYCDATRRVEPTDRLKCMRAGDDVRFSLSGEARTDGEYFSHLSLGTNSAGSGYLLQRYTLTGDLEVGDKVRFLSTLQSGIENGREGGPRPGVDEDRLFVHEAFLELRDREKEPSIDLRLGRQDLSFGAGRLIGYRELPNIERNFDGVRLTVSPQRWEISLLAFRPSVNAPGVFDDWPDHTTFLWGVYSTRKMKTISIDPYYLGFDQKSATYQAGTGREQRHTLGVRVAGARGHWDHDSEAAFQFGRFGQRSIRAWTITTYTGYTMTSRNGGVRYRVAMDAGVASGNQNPTRGSFGTFNALFPKGAYFGYANFLGPYNIQVIHPSLRVTFPSKRLVIWPNIAAFWRQSKEDGIYSIPGQLVQAGSPRNALYIGLQADLNVEWRQNRHITWSVDGEHFFSGTFLQQTRAGRDVNYFSPGVSFRF
jgi:hypothetical protein